MLPALSRNHALTFLSPDFKFTVNLTPISVGLIFFSTSNSPVFSLTFLTGIAFPSPTRTGFPRQVISLISSSGREAQIGWFNSLGQRLTSN